MGGYLDRINRIYRTKTPLAKGSPLGRKKIAQHFNAGNWITEKQVLQGRKKYRQCSFIPPGLLPF
jgi:hypothetical protein